MASPAEVEQWRKITTEQLEWLSRLSSERGRFKDARFSPGIAALWSEEFHSFLQQTVEEISDQVYLAALRRAVLKRLSIKQFDGIQVLPPYLQEALQSLQEFLNAVLESLTETIKSPWLSEESVQAPQSRPLQPADMEMVVRSIEDEAMMAMLDWAGERQACFRLLHAKHQEALEAYKRRNGTPPPDVKQPPALAASPNPQVDLK